MLIDVKCNHSCDKLCQVYFLEYFLKKIKSLSNLSQILVNKGCDIFTIITFRTILDSRKSKLSKNVTKYSIHGVIQ